MANLSQTEEDCVMPFKDRVFLLKMANHTVNDNDLLLQCQVFRAANLLADKMVEAPELKACLYKGIESIGAYLSPDHTEFDKERFEDLAQAIEVTKMIFNRCSTLERLQAIQAISHERIKEEFQNA